MYMCVLNFAVLDKCVTRIYVRITHIHVHDMMEQHTYIYMYIIIVFQISAVQVYKHTSIYLMVYFRYWILWL